MIVMGDAFARLAAEEELVRSVFVHVHGCGVAVAMGWYVRFTANTEATAIVPYPKPGWTW